MAIHINHAQNITFDTTDKGSSFVDISYSLSQVLFQVPLQFLSDFSFFLKLRL